MLTKSSLSAPILCCNDSEPTLLHSPSTVPILLVRTESVWSSQPPPHRPSLKRLRIDWLDSSTTRIHRAAVTVVEWRCSSMNIRSQSKPSVRTSSSHALQGEKVLQVYCYFNISSFHNILNTLSIFLLLLAHYINQCHYNLHLCQPLGILPLFESSWAIFQ